MIGKIYHLIEDHYSIRNKLYNKAGDKLKVITAEQDTWIVENEDGERYAINKSKLNIV